MSAPSAIHERRVEYIDAIAVLAGYTVRVVLGAGLDPDVARFDPRRRRLLVADAKATEKPGCRDTRMRLHAYATAAREWERVGIDVRLLLCHGTGDWAPLLEAVSSRAGFVAPRRGRRTWSAGRR